MNYNASLQTLVQRCNVDSSFSVRYSRCLMFDKLDIIDSFENPGRLRVGEVPSKRRGLYLT